MQDITTLWSEAHYHDYRVHTSTIVIRCCSTWMYRTSYGTSKTSVTCTTIVPSACSANIGLRFLLVQHRRQPLSAVPLVWNELSHSTWDIIGAFRFHLKTYLYCWYFWLAHPHLKLVSYSSSLCGITGSKLNDLIWLDWMRLLFYPYFSVITNLF